jgi:hypothetical protein
MDEELKARLEQFQARRSDDPVKTDLELTCIRCDEHLCDIEDADTLRTLVSVALSHECGSAEVDADVEPIGHNRIRAALDANLPIGFYHRMNAADAGLVWVDPEVDRLAREE